MNGARQTWLVAVREIRERSRSRAFLVSLVMMLVGVAAAIVLPGLLDEEPGTRDIGLTGSVPAELPAALRAQGEALDTTVRTHRYDRIAAGEQAVRDGDVDVLVANATTLQWRRQVDERLEAVVTGAIQLVAIRERAAAAAMPADDLLAVVAPVPVTNVEVGRATGGSADDETVAFVMSIVLFGAISTYGAMVLSGVVEEKSSRTVEVLLARMPARNLLAGKIAGIGLLGLTQIAATALVAIVAASVVDSVDVPAVRAGVVAWAVVWFLVGYALYATVFGALGSLASRTEDASSVTGPVTVVLVLAFMASFATIGSIDAMWARLVSWFPVTAPLAMPNRIAMGAATWWDPLVALLLTLGAIAGLVAIGGRVYTRAILHTGATLTLGEAWRGSRGPAVRPTPTPTTGRPRTYAALIGLAVALGGAAFALSRDVVIAVAVGAACYALGGRVVKGLVHVRR